MSLVRQLDPRLKVVDEQRSRRGEGSRGRIIDWNFTKHKSLSGGTPASFFLRPMLICLGGIRFFTIEYLSFCQCTSSERAWLGDISEICCPFLCTRISFECPLTSKSFDNELLSNCKMYLRQNLFWIHRNQHFFYLPLNNTGRPRQDNWCMKQNFEFTRKTKVKFQIHPKSLSSLGQIIWPFAQCRMLICR